MDNVEYHKEDKSHTRQLRLREREGNWAIEKIGEQEQTGRTASQWKAGSTTRFDSMAEKPTSKDIFGIATLIYKPAKKRPQSPSL
ncbi:hypothetical protein HYFRA_00009384 [Hymenoscyphus fraxineus]|uniref:Uncharacterized protein n=1 Tax=Hymenoscyphus fraxineus TaxID=746836 RepID=A0A9N9L2T3_9HELO|nr:hypothetical protein HYFRA_00009384 [Hymenoscyphus fraxineus]